MRTNKFYDHRCLTSDKATVQKIKFSIKDFFSKCEQIRSFLQIWSYLLKKSLMENFIFCVVSFLLLLYSTRSNEETLQKANTYD